jgi:hypothetical protein
MTGSKILSHTCCTLSLSNIPIHCSNVAGPRRTLADLRDQIMPLCQQTTPYAEATALSIFGAFERCHFMIQHQAGGRQTRRDFKNAI